MESECGALTAAPTLERPNPPGEGTLALRRKWIGRGLLALFVLGAAAVWRNAAAPPSAEEELVLQGNVDVRQVSLSFKVGGRIQTLFVDEGDKVQPGQLLAALDEAYFQDNLRLAQAQRDQAKANLLKLEHGSRPEEIAQARATVADRKAALLLSQQTIERGRKLIRSQSLSKEELDQEQAATKEAEAQLNLAEQSLRLAELGPRVEDIDAARAQLDIAASRVVQVERELSDSRLYAPNEGIVLTRAREKGAIVQPGETVLTVTLTSPVWVRTYVGEPDLGRVRPGLKVRVATDWRAHKEYTGQVGFVSPVAEFTPKQVETRELRTQLVYRLRINVADDDGRLLQGMPVTVRLEGAPRPHSPWKRLTTFLSFERQDTLSPR